MDGSDALTLAGDHLRLTTAVGEFNLPMPGLAYAKRPPPTPAALPDPALAGNVLFP